VLPWVALALIVVAAVGWYFANRYGYHFVGHWPFLHR
jgi:hypothetical protein